MIMGVEKEMDYIYIMYTVFGMLQSGIQRENHTGRGHGRDPEPDKIPTVWVVLIPGSPFVYPQIRSRNCPMG